ncbi:MAG: SCO family protein [Betaproteobacteria bacterium]|nr:SCO family protein [Betaproteobacteria bacterium]
MPPLRHLLAFLLIATALAGCSEQRVEPPAPKGGDFVLRSAGGPLDTKTLRGKVLLIYFGYTHCPDVCPASLAAGAQTLNTLTTEERAKVRLIMVSVDPERDTPERLKEYAAYFHPEMVGVTGTPEEIAAVAKSFGAGYLRQPARPDGSYAVDHTTRTYVMAPDGKLAVALELNAPAEKYLETVRGLLR